MIKKPSDLGYSDDRYQLPPLHKINHTVLNDDLFITNNQMSLFVQPARTMTEVRQEQANTIDQRCEKAVDLALGKTSVYWCNLNQESAMLAKLDPDAVEILGPSHRTGEGVPADDQVPVAIHGRRIADGAEQYTGRVIGVGDHGASVCRHVRILDVKALLKGVDKSAIRVHLINLRVEILTAPVVP